MKVIIDELVELKKQEKILKNKINTASSKIQEKGIEIFEDKNIKTTEIFGNENSSALVTYSQKLEILNFQALEKVLGRELIEEKIERKHEIKYDLDSKFKEAIIILYTGDYISNLDLDEFIKNEFPELDNTQQNLLLKKLKGDYKKDKELLNKYVDRKDLDVELHFINKIKNYEKVKVFFDVNDEEVKKAINTYVSLDENIKLTIKYEE